MNAFLERSKTSFRLLVCSLRVMRREKKLLLFPVVNLGFAFFLVLFFLAPVVFFPTGHALSEAEHWAIVRDRFIADLGGNGDRPQLTTLGYSYLAGCYMVVMFAATFINVAFYHEIIQALAGARVSLRRGFAMSCRRIRAILLWSLFAGTIGLLIRALAERMGWVGRWVMRTIGLVWSVASVFAIPVLVRSEEQNPVQVLQNSARTLKQTWGEALAGYLGLRGAGLAAVLGIGAVMVISWISLIVLGALLDQPAFLLLFPLILLIGLGSLVLYGFLASLAENVFRCALYVYATEGVPPEGFAVEEMDGAWKIKQAKPA